MIIEFDNFSSFKIIFLMLSNSKKFKHLQPNHKWQRVGLKKKTETYNYYFQVIKHKVLLDCLIEIRMTLTNNSFFSIIYIIF